MSEIVFEFKLTANLFYNKTLQNKSQLPLKGKSSLLASQASPRRQTLPVLPMCLKDAGTSLAPDPVLSNG